MTCDDSERPQQPQQPLTHLTLDSTSARRGRQPRGVTLSALAHNRPLRRDGDLPAARVPMRRCGSFDLDEIASSDAPDAQRGSTY